MYAVLRTGNKQYKVEQGTIFNVEKLPGEAGQTIEFNDVLLFCTDGLVQVGQPQVKGAVVRCEILEQKKAPKVIIFKKLRRQGKKLKKGHRQQITRLKVKELELHR